MSDWQYQGKPYTQAQPAHAGFVYLIHDTHNNRFYIGKKLFWTTRKLPPLKGKQNKRHRRVDSDWRTYWGSSRNLQQQIDLLGQSLFTRTILVLCKTKTDMAYHETRLQIENRVLFRDDFYNDFIGCRITSRGLTYENNEK